MQKPLHQIHATGEARKGGFSKNEPHQVIAIIIHSHIGTVVKDVMDEGEAGLSAKTSCMKKSKIGTPFLCVILLGLFF